MHTTVKHGQKALAFLVGASDVNRIFRDWPKDMCAAVCLKDDGDCKMLVYREEEGSQFLARLTRVLALNASDICFVPEIKGYPSRRLSYSEEKQLLTLVRSAPEIVEEARDYSLNYTYALDEGIDPQAFLCVASGKTDAKEKTPDHRPGNPEPRPQEIPTKKSEQPHDRATQSNNNALPRFMQRPHKDNLDISTETKGQARSQENSLKTVFILPEQDGWISIDLPGCSGAEENVRSPGRFFIRDDRRAIALNIIDLASQGSAALPARIKLEVNSLPKDLRLILESSSGEMPASLETGFLLVSTLPTVTNQAIAPTQTQRHTKRSPWSLWVSTAAIAAIAAISFQTNLLQRSPIGYDDSIDWSQFRNETPGTRDQPTANLAERRLGQLNG